MKKLVLVFSVMVCFTLSAVAQSHTKKDGTPDMRYIENRNPYGTVRTFNSTPPRTIYNSNNMPSYEPIYKTIYSPPYPTNINGTPDMRNSNNKLLFGKPW